MPLAPYALLALVVPLLAVGGMVAGKAVSRRASRRRAEAATSETRSQA